MEPMTVKELLTCKGRRKLTMIATNDPNEAEACELAGIDIIACGAQTFPQLRVAAPNCFTRPAVPRPTYKASNADAIRSAYTLMEQGADSVYMCPGIERIRAVAGMKIPVFGHVGMVPDNQTWIGGFRAVGKTAGEAEMVYREVLELQDAGAIGVEMEVVPDRIAAEIARRVEICVISLGSGSGCDAECLFACDILGSHNQHYPRHARKYRNLYEDSVGAFSEYRKEVESGVFPSPANTVEIKEEEFDRFMEQLD
jgi:3-methyl-2-oxobutanoate hydroxymethyltransferase